MVKLRLQELVRVLASTDQTGAIKSIPSELLEKEDHEFIKIIHSNLYED